jgi:hypothetical protein
MNVIYPCNYINDGLGYYPFYRRTSYMLDSLSLGPVLSTSFFFTLRNSSPTPLSRVPIGLHFFQSQFHFIPPDISYQYSESIFLCPFPFFLRLYKKKTIIKPKVRERGNRSSEYPEGVKKYAIKSSYFELHIEKKQ